ncbi:MAG: DUF2934 domain-containing protein [Deltaproteobacteria bacterium]|nr:DUF2934 domain-containing protein [Deltaproteobacteria bacterium]
MNFEEKVKKLAYELYVRNGRRPDRELLDWLAAERIVRFEEQVFSGMDKEGIRLIEYRPLTEARPLSARQANRRGLEKRPGADSRRPAN